MTIYVNTNPFILTFLSPVCVRVTVVIYFTLNIKCIYDIFFFILIGKFTCLEVVFKFKRRLGYYLFHTYVPTCLIVIMSWISFWIKPEAVPARVTLGVTSLLTLSTQHANSQKSLPPVSYIKAIDVFMSGCTVFVFLSLMEYALVNIVMGDIADIEKKKSMGISNLILGSRGLPIRQKEGGINQEVIFCPISINYCYFFRTLFQAYTI